jgi:polar amino acid transport system substrate-binding protein
MSSTPLQPWLRACGVLALAWLVGLSPVRAAGPRDRAELAPAAATAASATADETVAICDGAPEWPPFTYFKREAGKPTEELTGYSVEVLSSILNKARLPFRIELLPWRRCLDEVARGARFQIALEASFSRERADTFLLTRPFYRTTSHYFYSRQRFPEGPKIERLADLKRYRICGLLGYNYALYGLASGAVDQANGDHTVLVKRLQLGRCELFVEQLEVIAGYRAVGPDLLADPDLGHAAIPGLPSSEFHMLISRQSRRGAELLRLIDAGIAELESTRQLEKLWAKHVR